MTTSWVRRAASAGGLLGLLALLFLAVFQLPVRTAGVLPLLQGDSLANLAIQTVALGVLTMAIIQTARTIYPFRGRFHRKRLHEWLGNDGYATLKKLIQFDRDAAGRSELWLVDIPLEQLTGQLSVAADMALVSPKEHEKLLKKLAGTDNTSPVSDLVAADEHTLKARNRMKTALEELRKAIVTRDELQQNYTTAQANDTKDRETLKARLDNARTTVQSHRHALEEMKELDDQPDEATLAARARVGFAVQRSIDAFQARTGTTWKLRLRVVAIVLASYIAFIMIWSKYFERQATLLDTLLFALPSMMGALLAGVIAAFMAGVARDLAATIERARR